MNDHNEPRIEELLSRREIQWRDVLSISEVGSTAHGIAIEGFDDLDLTVIRLEPFFELVTGSESRQSMMIRTKPEGVRSQAGDIDLQVYTARKFAKLALGGNPSILNVLYVPSHYHQTVYWIAFKNSLQLYTPSRRAGNAFLGYMRQQMERWQGLRGQKNVTRPELVEAYGFDTKYAAHLIRLGYQGTVYMLEGRIPIPLPSQFAEAIRELRTGKLTEGEALDWATEIENKLHQAIIDSKLPEGPNHAMVDQLLAETYFQSFMKDVRV